MHLIYIYDKEKLVSLVSSAGLGSFSTSNVILFQFWWTSPDHHILLCAPWLMFSWNDYYIFLFCYSDHESWPVYLQRHDRSWSPWAVCRVYSARSCLYTPQIVAIKSCPCSKSIRMPSPSTVVSDCRQCLRWVHIESSRIAAVARDWPRHVPNSSCRKLPSSSFWDSHDRKILTVKSALE